MYLLLCLLISYFQRDRIFLICSKIDHHNIINEESTKQIEKKVEEITAVEVSDSLRSDFFFFKNRFFQFNL